MNCCVVYSSTARLAIEKTDFLTVLPYPLKSGTITGDSMKTRDCTKCSTNKPLSDFPKHKKRPNGHGAICKTCTAIKQKMSHDENRETHNARARGYYRNNIEKQRERCRQKDLANGEKRKARNIVRSATRNGNLVVGDCVDCGNKPDDHNIDAHHEDYNKPLEVIWLCRSCHMIRHRDLKGNIQ